MLRSLYSGISGMKVNQTKMDVIGNNISNVGTTAFKSSRARFQDMLSQSVTSAMAPSTNLGGVNPSQVGLGVQLGGVDTVVSQGMMQPTARNLDVAIDGEGYFMVGKGPTVFQDGNIQVNQQAGTHNVNTSSLSNSKMEISYTRDGAFTLDNDGNLLTSDGYRILGYGLTNDSPSVSPTAQAPNVVTAGGFNFQFGPGASLNGYKVVLGNVAADTVTSADVDKATKTIVLNGDFSAAGAVTSDQAASAINKALNAAGIPQTVQVNGTNTAITGLTATISGGTAVLQGITFKFDNSTHTDLEGYTLQVGDMSGLDSSVSVDTNSKKIIINGDFLTNGGIDTADLKNKISAALLSKAINEPFAATNAITGASAMVTGAESALTNGGTPVESIGSDGSISYVDATKDVKAYDDSLKTLRIPDKVKIPGENTELRVRSFSIDKTGLISGVLEDGRVAALGQIATSSFKNPAGLTKMGKDLYSASVNSGEATLRSGVGTLGEDNSKGYGDLNQGMLEMSNVDLAEQFTDMIVTSRAFQAAGKMITTGDEILQDIINLKR
ncbi:MAG: flagellar hook-basal body complex protein [Bacillota bacterium]|nr:flagellar hook-basal body complex protein [Bacillota bacterium]